MGRRLVPAAAGTLQHPLPQSAGTDWYLDEWKTKGHGVTWALIIFTHATPVSGVKHLRLNPFFRIAEAHGWLKPSW